MLRLGKLIQILFVLGGLWGCANQISPTGGKGDETPPEITKTVPITQALRVDASTIKIYFSEAVKKPTYNKELFISPLLKRPPRIYLSDSGKRIKIKIEEGLADSTTYVITLKEIQDHFGGNKLEQVFTFAFSTGPFIDSMEIKGEVQHPILGKGQEEMILMLFPADSIQEDNFLGKRPEYISQTDKAGRFIFKNLRRMPYRLYGLVDVDQSATYSQFTEVIALADSSLIIFPDTASMVETRLYSFLPDNQAPTFRNYVWLNDSTWLGEFTDPFLGDSLKVTLSDSAGSTTEIPTFTLLPTPTNELIFHTPVSSQDSMSVTLIGIRDSLNNREDTIVALRGSRTREIEKPLVQKPEFNFDSTGWELFSYWLQNPVDTQFVILTDTARYRTSTSDTLPELPAIAEDIPYVNKLPIEIETYGFYSIIRPTAKIPPSNTYLLHIRGRVIGMEDTVFRYKLNLPDPEEFGTWSGLVRPDKFRGPLVVQLIKDKSVVRQAFDSTFHFRYLSPGSYQIQVIYDQDGNKTWTPGNTNPYRLPEKIYRYPTETTIRANWDIEGDTLEVKFDIPIEEPKPDTTQAVSGNRNSQGQRPQRAGLRPGFRN